MTALKQDYKSGALWIPPVNPDSRNEEFVGTTLNAAWVPCYVSASLSAGTVNAYDTSFNSGTVLRYDVGSKNSWCLLQAPGNNTPHGIAKPITLNTNDLIICRMKFCVKTGTAVNNESNVGLNLCANLAGVPDINNSVNLFLNEQDGSTVQAQAETLIASVFTQIAVTDTSNRRGSPLEYVAIHKIGTTYHFWSGTASGNWIYMGNAVVGLTIAWVVLKVQNFDITAPGASIGGFDFVRFYNTSNFLF